jgi:hypothetical protein
MKILIFELLMCLDWLDNCLPVDSVEEHERERRRNEEEDDEPDDCAEDRHEVVLDESDDLVVAALKSKTKRHISLAECLILTWTMDDVNMVDFLVQCFTL